MISNGFQFQFSFHGALNDIGFDQLPIKTMDSNDSYLSITLNPLKRKIKINKKLITVTSDGVTLKSNIKRKRKIIIATLDGLGDIGYSTPFCRSGIMSTIVSCRGNYKASNANPIKRNSLALSIRNGKIRIPRVDGSKRLITRAIVIAMMNSSYKGDPSPIKIIRSSSETSGTMIRILHPKRFVYAILSSYREFSDGEFERIRSNSYTDRMLKIISNRSFGLKLDDLETKDIQAFHAMLRSSEVCPSCMVDKNNTKRIRDWFSESEWIVSHDLLHGIMLDYRKWDYYFDSLDREPSIDSSPYAKRFVDRLSRVVKESMESEGL